MLSVTLHYSNFILPFWIVFFLVSFEGFFYSLMWVFIKDQRRHFAFALFNSLSWWAPSFSWPLSTSLFRYWSLSSHSMPLGISTWIFKLNISKNSCFLQNNILSYVSLSLSYFCSLKPQPWRQFCLLFFHDPSISNQSLFLFHLHKFCTIPTLSFSALTPLRIGS